MKTIGLIGGMSWQSTTDYYKHINTLVNNELGSNNSAKILLHSLNFQEIETEQKKGHWDILAIMIVDAAQKLEKAGADMILICANTMHKVYDEVSEQVKIPVVHIAQACALKINPQKLKNIPVGLLGTKYTMSQKFLKNVLTQNGLEVMVPDHDIQQSLHDVIINELCKGVTTKESFDLFNQEIIKFHNQGCDHVILGCTEIPLLINQNNYYNSYKPQTIKRLSEFHKISLIDSTLAHCEAAVRLALS
jgi:aspartate racemase